MIAPAVALLVAAFIAGHPVQIMCDIPDSATAVEAWSTPCGSFMHMKPSVCVGLTQKVGGTEHAVGQVSFAHAIGTVIHESAHAKGVRSEACAEMYADIGVFDVLRRFYGVPFFTPLSWLVGRQVRDHTLHLPPNYQPTSGSCIGEPRG